MIVGIVGNGMVGRQVKRWFDKVEVIVHDLKGKPRLAEMEQADIIFICIPTPFNSKCSKGVDITPFMELIGQFDKPNTFVIKSTIPIGFTELIQSEYPQHKILHNPEFLSEKTAWKDFSKPPMQLVGYTKQSKRTAQFVMDLLPRSKYQFIINSKESEFYKLMRNSYLATKVSFFNSVYAIASQNDVEYNNIHRIIKIDNWIGNNHTVVNHKGYRGFGGKCLPKDISILSHTAKTGILKEVIKYNGELLECQGMKEQLNKWVKGV